MGIFTDAAKIILTQNRRPLPSEDITKLAVQQGLLERSSYPIHATMDARIRADIRKEGRDSFFVRIRPGVYAARKAPTLKEVDEARKAGSSNFGVNMEPNMEGIMEPTKDLNTRPSSGEKTSTKINSPVQTPITLSTGVGLVEVAKTVLAKSDRPLSFKEITGIAMTRGLLKTSGRNLDANMNARINTDISRKGRESFFVRVGPGIYDARIRQESKSAKPSRTILSLRKKG